LIDPAAATAGAPQREPRPRRESGHPISHAFTRAIPTSQCMTCHMHQPNIFLNSYLGYTMWDYESDAPQLWPGPDNSAPRPSGMSDEEYQKTYKQQRYPTAAEVHQVLERNPEGAAPRGLWADVEFLRDVYDVNDSNKDTQFADYHGHGWNFRGIFKRDREGNLLNADGNMSTYGTDTANIVNPKDPEKWRKSCSHYSEPKERDLCLASADPDKPGVEGKFVPPGINPGKAVHMMDIHAEKGMQCADCHFAQDAHGNGYIQGEVANAVEISCKDCHGTADAFPNLLTSNVAARPQGNNLALLRNPDGRRRFEFQYNDDAEVIGLIQRSIVDPKLEWQVSLVKQAVTPGPHFNAKAARAKLMARASSDDGKFEWGPGVATEDRAHGDDKMTCFTCHLSWTTSCGGCHLPIEANWKTKMHHFEGEETRNFATYNPQVARDEMFQLGRHQLTKPGEPGPNGEARGIITPVRSTSALILSSTNINRERIYVQQPPISSAGYSSQAFAPHFPHTVRRSETKQCSDCHLSAADDNNAIMAQLNLLGTNFVNFVGLNVWSGMEDGFQATRVTEWDEPQAVIGSYLQKYAYPDFWKLHVEQNGRELKNWVRGKTFDKKGSGETHALEEFANIVQDTSGRVNCLQQRGEYMFVAEGRGGFRVYDVASIGNKGFSERIIRAPFSALGHDTHVKTRNATCMAIATTQPISVSRNENIVKNFPENHEQVMHDIYRYAVITDSVEGLVLVDIDTMADAEFRNRGQCAGGGAACDAGRQHGLYHHRCRARRARLVDAAPAQGDGAAAADRRARQRGAVPLSLGHRCRGGEAVRCHQSRAAGRGTRGDRSAGQCAQNLSCADLHVCRGQVRRAGHRRCDAPRGADRLAGPDLWRCDDRCRGRHRRIDQCVAVRLRRRRARRHQGAPADQSRQSRPLWLLAQTDSRTDRLGQDPVAGAGAVEGSRPRPRCRRDRRADGGVRASGLAAVHPARDGEAVSEQQGARVQGPR